MSGKGIFQEEKRKLLRNIFVARFIDVKVEKLWRRDIVHKWPLSHIGQEAGPTALCSLLAKKDILIPPYRGYAHVISKGLPVEMLAAEMLGKKQGPAHGLGHRGNYVSPELGVYPNSVVLGSNFGVAVGMALAIRHKKDDRIVAFFFGDGASTRPACLSAVNLSVLWGLPILWVCENNQYSASTRFGDTAKTSLGERISSLGISFEKMDGNDLYAIYERGRFLIHLIHQGRKPFFIELETYRVAAHNVVMTDSSYQDDDERKYWLSKDPIASAIRACIGGGMNKQDIADIKDAAFHEVETAFETAERYPPLSEDELLGSYEN